MARIFGRRQQPERPPNPFLPAPEDAGGEWAAAGDLLRRRKQAEAIANHRPGRPALDEKTKRLDRINISVNKPERARLEQAAESAGVRVTQWVREAALRDVERMEGGDESAATVVEEVNRLRAELNRTGNNLNQIARALNAETRGGPPIDRDGVRAILDEFIESQREQRARLRALTGEEP